MSVNNQGHQDPATQQLKLHCKVLQIDNQAATFRCDEYRKLLLPQDPGEPLTLEPEPVAPVGPVVLTDAAVGARQRSDDPSGARGGQACAIYRGGGRGWPRARQSQISIPTGPRVSVTGQTSLCEEGHRRFSSPALARHFLFSMGLRGSSLSQQDAALASRTPNLTTMRFTQLFGGTPRNERPRSREHNIICVNQVAQPYAPHAPGEPGVLFIFPSIVRSQDDYACFHFFIEMSPPKTSSEERRYQYLGIYTKVPTTDTTVEVGEWLTLPIKESALRSAWSLRVSSSIVPDVRTVHARIFIRNSRPHGPPPSLDEINAWLKTNSGSHRRISKAMVDNAFNSGEESIKFDLVKCIGYDVEIAGKIQA